MKTAPILLAAALALGLAACDNNRDTGDETVGADTAADAADGMGAGPVASTADAADMTTGDQAPPATGAPAAEGDRKALMAVQEVNRHEIAASEDALAKDVQGEVRAYAETLRDEHTRNHEATGRLMGGPGGNGAMDHGAMTADAATAGASDPELAAMKQKHDAERTRLAALEGDAFSTAWVDAMVKGHGEALAKLDNELIPGASDAAVTTHLQDTRTTIARHLETARSLQSDSR